MKADVTAHILDTATGKRATYRYEASFEADGSFGDYFWWTDGNFGCDCNRGIVSKVWTVGETTGNASTGKLCGETRFVVEKIVRDDTKAVVFTDPRLEEKKE